MTNFEFFRKQCNDIKEGFEIRFACHIIYHNYMLELIEDDLQKLNSIDEKQIFYFEGEWEYNHKFVGISTYSDSQDMNELRSDENYFIVHYNRILYTACDMGVEVNEIEKFIPKLFQEYDRKEKEKPETYAAFSECWEEFMSEWKEYVKGRKTNFEYCREQCRITGIFSCHIFSKNHSLELIENDLQKLNSVDEGQVFYFEGVWKAKENENLFADISTVSRCQDPYAIYSIWGGQMHSYSSLRGTMLYRLYEMGIEVSVIERIIPQLLKEYERQEKEWYERQGKEWSESERFYFVKTWNKHVNEWRSDCNEEINRAGYK